MTSWVALGREADGFVGYLIEGGTVTAQANAADAADVLTQLNAAEAPVVRIAQGEPSLLPCAVLPEAGLTVPALSQSAPADLISGWVRLWVAGYLADHADWDGLVLVLHGDVVHWLHISASEVVSSVTSLTPRFHAALGMALALPDTQAVADTLSRPERLMTHLRAAEVRGDASACLGHFIGADLAATRAYWLGVQAVVIGDGNMAEGYGSALQGQGVPVEVVAPAEVLPKGLVALSEKLFPL